ncbi:aspartate aminotransferase family protein [Nocardia brasiliensis]|uniref:aspartate aminotransferase family protein n=1 Tax=Nocardia brasiliensis TaxID=37326 RepID=UPI003670B36C
MQLPQIDTGVELVIDRYRRHISSGLATVAQLSGGTFEQEAHGCWVLGGDGRRYLDVGGFGVFLLGHSHPAVVEAVCAQVRRRALATRMLLDPVLARAAETVARAAPAGLDYVHFVNSGAEAVETALKIARLHGCRGIISAHGGFHGKTMGALSVTSNDKLREPFRPLLPEVTAVPFGDAAALAAALEAAPQSCCVIVEPVQGEGGVRIPPPGYLTQVRDLCTANDAVFVLDEVQTGLGRLGRWWGAEFDAVVPDILLVGKGLSGGVVPVAAAICAAPVYAPLSADPFLHPGTFAGNPLAATAAHTVVQVIEREGIVAAASALGERLLARLTEVLMGECPELITEVRGRGLMIGIDCVSPPVATELTLGLRQRAVLTNPSINAGTVVRLTPAAVMSPADEEFLFQALAETAADIAEFGHRYR